MGSASERKKWLIDQNGKKCSAGELWAPNLEKILGPTFSYLPSQIPFEGSYRSFGQFLGIKVSANLPDVINYLENLSQAGVTDFERIRPIYQYLSGRGKALADYVNAFKIKPLIFIPEKGWFKATEVCWQDELGLVPSVKPAWEKLEEFFVEHLGISKKATPEQVIAALRERSRKNSPLDENLKAVYDRLWQWYRKGELGESPWSSLKYEAILPGRMTDGVLQWSRADSLVRRDDASIAPLFEGKVVWWAFESLDEFAEKLGIPRISEAKPVVIPQEPFKEDEATTNELNSVWPYVRWFTENKVFSQVPKVKIPAGIKIVYRFGRIESLPSTNTSWFDNEKGVVYLANNSGLELKYELAEAFRLGLKNLGIDEQISEFIKDILDENLTLEKRFLLIERQWLRKLKWDTSKLDELKGLIKLLPEPVGPKPIIIDPIRPKPIIDPIRPKPPEPDGPRPPIRPSGEKPRNTGRVLPSGEVLDEVEKVAMDEAIKRCEAAGYKVTNVSDRDVGCDLELLSGDGRKIFVEVKGRSDDRPSIDLTPAEWERAQQEGKNYWIIVVLLERPSLVVRGVRRIVGPTEEFFEKKTRYTYESSYADWFGNSSSFDYTRRLYLNETAAAEEND